MKIVRDIVIVAGVVLCFVILAALQPYNNEIIATANASANWTGIEDAQAAVNSYPLYSWFLPPLMGFILMVVNHRSA
jgi:hypothetical protein